LTNPGATPATPARLLAELRDGTIASLRGWLGGHDAVALLGFPNYANVGDSAIWLGTLAYLRGLGIGLRYVCDAATYAPARLASRIGRGVILLQGGGDFGDLWPDHQAFREEVVAAFPHNPIVQLPQSIYFRDRAALARAQAVLDRHPNFTLLVRDHRSLELARAEFRARSELCPDMAFGLGPLRRPQPPVDDVVWLARTDLEAVPHGGGLEGAGVTPMDWLDERAVLPRLMTRLGRTRFLRRRGMGWARAAMIATFDGRARQRLDRGCRLLSRGRAVITDRLHGHILCLLLGIPHVLLDNSYGKNRSFYETWTRGCELARWAETPPEALRLLTQSVERAARSGERA
jgi:pyruvyl transferase EpsO